MLSFYFWCFMTAKQRVDESTTLEIEMPIQGDLSGVRTFLVKPAPKFKPKPGHYKMYVTEKGKGSNILLTIHGTPLGMRVIISEVNPVFNRADTEKAMGLIGDAIANKMTAISAQQVKH
jgi:hypothetical protein